jgi:hypothetical protein
VIEIDRVSQLREEQAGPNSGDFVEANPAHVIEMIGGHSTK